MFVFVAETKKADAHQNNEGSSIDTTVCGGIWKVPRNCDPDNGTCEYSAKWEYVPRGDEIKFTITTTNTDTWTGIAFSNDDKMVK